MHLMFAGNDDVCLCSGTTTVISACSSITPPAPVSATRTFVKNVTGNPANWRGHAPMLGGEWWGIEDGFRWHRPFRDVFACGEADGIVRHEPIRSGHDLLWIDENKKTIEGFEAAKCLIDDLDIPSRRMEWENYGGALLTWEGRPLIDLKDRNVRLRFHFRDARIYGVRWE